MTDRRTALRLVIPSLLALALAGCSVVAAPLHIAADVIDRVPIVGGVVAGPFEATADLIDTDRSPTPAEVPRLAQSDVVGEDDSGCSLSPTRRCLFMR